MIVNSKRRISPRLLVAAAAVLALSGTAGAQDKITGTVKAGAALKINIAIPAAEAGADSADTARQLVETVREDLEFSGFFNLVDPRFYKLVPVRSDGSVAHEDWISVGADSVTSIRVSIRGDRLDVQVRLYQNESKSELFGNRYGGRKSILRRIAHQISNDIVKFQTGQEGIAMTRIAFVSRHGDGKDAGKEIYLMDYDGQRVRRLTTSGTINLTPVWSPSGDELAFMSYMGRQPAVYAMTAEGKLLTLNTLGGNLSSAPDWSNDGSKLAYSSDVDGNTEVYIFDRSTGRNTRLTRHPAIDTSPAWSPNGREVAFTSDRTGSPQIYLMDAEGLNVRRISWTGNYNESAAWSPKGDRLAYVSRVSGRFEVYVLDVATDQTTRLTRGQGNNENPAWAPDGRHLVFASDRAGSYDIYTMRDDGSDARRLTRNGDCYTPHWSP